VSETMPVDSGRGLGPVSSPATLVVRNARVYTQDPRRPVLNRAAVRAAGLTKDTPDPAGGQIVRSWDGEPTGLLLATSGGWSE
jgi:hypothetical protein